MGPNDISAGRDRLAFAEDWLREQQRFWEAFRREGSSRESARAEQAWSDACERWWRAVHDMVPAPLAAQLRTALEHTRLWVHLASLVGDDEATADALAAALSPERLYAAAADAMREAEAAPDPFEDPRYLRAFQMLMALLTDTIQEALAAIRDRLEHEGARTPCQVHTIYSEEIERRYLQVAGSDAFVRAVGELVNARVAQLPPRERRRR